MILFKKKLVITVLILLTAIQAHAQFVNYGTDPAHYKWNIVRTSHYNLIYPQGNDSLAYHYISMLENAYPHIEHSLGKPFQKKYPVVLHPGSMLSNGMVSWAPRRMEMITTPSSDLYAQSWDRQLVLHESRHIIQTGKLMNGLVRPFYYLFGEQTQAVPAVLIPKWFFEGDAVITETALSHSGRGRLPEFNMIYRSKKIADDFYNYDKWYLGSYKDHTGTFYALGYNMTSYARHQYGMDVWDRVTNRYVKRITFPPFGKALKHETGGGVKQLFNQTFSFLEQDWQTQEEAYQQSGFNATYLSPSDKHYNSYQYPQALNDSVILAVRTNLKDLNALVTITKGEEKQLTYLGAINSRIVLNHNKVYWTEYVSGLRWTHQNYSVLKYYDLSTKRVHSVTPHKRYLSPSINKNGTIAAVSEASANGEHHIVLVHTKDGKEHARFSIPRNAFAKELTYTDEDNIIATTVDDEGIRLLELDTQSGKWSELLEATSANITAPTWHNGKLLFESGVNGTNNIYEYNPATSQYLRLTTARFGAFTPAVSADGSKLLFADYQANGYHLAEVAVNSLQKEPADFDEPHRFQLAESMAAQEQFNFDTATIHPIEFQPKRYNKAAHLFKAHSWAPFYYDIAEVVNLQSDDFSTIVKPGAMVISQNSLNTAIAQAGWYYKDSYHHGKALFSYSGLYPVFDIEVDYGGKAINIEWAENEEGKRGTRGRRTDRDFVEAEARMYIPFNLTRRHYIRGIQPILTYFYTNNKYEQFNSGKLRNFQYMLSELRFYNYRKMAKQDIFPRWGYQMRLQHLFSPANTENYGNLYTARLTTYSPGFVRGDGLMLRAGYQYQSLDHKYLYLPKRLLNEVRGYDYIYATRQQFTFQADYSFKLCNPDLSLGSLLYVQRVRSNVFYDIARNQANKINPWTTQSSYGADLIMDCNILQTNFPVSLGVRVINPIDYGNVQAEALFNITF